MSLYQGKTPREHAVAQALEQMEVAHALNSAAQQLEQEDSASLNRDAHLVVNRVYQNDNNLVFIPKGKVTPQWIATIPQASAFTREELMYIVSRAVNHAVMLDRECRPDDGWVQRGLAGHQMLVFVTHALEAQHVPKDAIGPILEALRHKLREWTALE